jgi:hypothetical protein
MSRAPTFACATTVIAFTVQVLWLRSIVHENYDVDPTDL